MNWSWSFGGDVTLWVGALQQAGRHKFSMPAGKDVAGERLCVVENSKVGSSCVVIYFVGLVGGGATAKEHRETKDKYFFLL